MDSGKVHNAGEGDGFVLSGIDKLGGGTWLGINRQGDVALLTNITEPSHNLASTRGQLCASFLLRDTSTSQNLKLPQYVTQIKTLETQYAGFNLLLLAPVRTFRSVECGGKDDLAYDVALLSNCGAGNRISSFPPSENSGRLGSISNATMTRVDTFTGLKEEAEWPKTAKGRELFSNVLRECVGETEEVLLEKLFHMMRTKSQSPPRTRQEFQKTIMVDVVDMSSGVSSWQTETKYYATRLASVLLIRKDGQVLFVERDVWVTNDDGEPIIVGEGYSDLQGGHERRHRFQIS